MTPKERAELVRDQYIAGLKNGEAIAGTVIRQFADGFTGEVGIEIRNITDKALAHVIDKLTANGIDKKYRQPFADGFNAGLAKTYFEYAANCAARALLRTSYVGR